MARSYADVPPTLLGNTLCLDFVNTVGWRGRPEANADRLVSYDELALWAGHAGALGGREVAQLRSQGRRRPDAAAAVLVRAVELREALARLLSRSGRAGDLATLNAVLARAPERTAVEAMAGDYRWRRAGGLEPLEALLWPVAWDAAALLTSDRLAGVRSCGDAECGWMFLDLSKAHNRRWCSMKDCGNRAKARRHYARQTG